MELDPARHDPGHQQNQTRPRPARRRPSTDRGRPRVRGRRHPARRRLQSLDRAGFAIVASGLQQCLSAGDELDSVDVKKMEKLFLSLA